MARRVILSLVLLVAVVAIGGFALAWHPAIAPVPAPKRADFAEAQVARGAELAAIGDCAVCHTAPDGRAYAGGRGVPTPFGVVYATNITPDPATGIGTLVGGGVPPGHAGRDRSGGTASVSGVALSAFHPGDR